MGTSISIDKHVSSLEEILEMTPGYFDKIKFESKISPEITQHLKVFVIMNINLFRSGNSLRTRKSLKASKAIQFCSATFNRVDSFFLLRRHICYYLFTNQGLRVIINQVYFIFLANCNLALFPHSLWGLVQSAENLTPRGLSNAFSTNDINEEFLQNHQLDSFLLSKRRGHDDERAMLNDETRAEN